MAETCPNRIHIPRPKPEPTKWYQCPYCEKRHRTQQQIITCKGYSEWYKALERFKAQLTPIGYHIEGTREEVYPSDVLAFDGFENVRAHIWPWMVSIIRHRDKGICQDCGLETSSCEVHHIIARAKGGSDHPANLKLVCPKCHRRYTDELLGELGPLRAKKNHIEKTKALVSNSIEDF
jgi:5-methylcytosine-specific restriction protein A